MFWGTRSDFQGHRNKVMRHSLWCQEAAEYQAGQKTTCQVKEAVKNCSRPQIASEWWSSFMGNNWGYVRSYQLHFKRKKKQLKGTGWGWWGVLCRASSWNWRSWGIPASSGYSMVLFHGCFSVCWVLEGEQLRDSKVPVPVWNAHSWFTIFESLWELPSGSFWGEKAQKTFHKSCKDCTGSYPEKGGKVNPICWSIILSKFSVYVWCNLVNNLCLKSEHRRGRFISQYKLE